MKKITTMLAMILMVTLTQAQPIASFTLDTNYLCNPQWPAPSNVTFTPTNTSDTSSAVGPITYYWQMPSGMPSTSSSINPGPIDFNGIGKYPIKLTVYAANGSSTYFDTVEIMENPFPYIGLDTNSFNPFCNGDSAILTSAYSGGYLTYLWSTANTSVYHDTNGFGGIISYSKAVCYSTDTYSCTITNLSGCSVFVTYDIIVNPLPTPIISPYLSNYLVSNINLGNQWYLDSVLMVGQTGQQLFVPVVNGTYNVQVTDANGCVGWSPDYEVTVGIEDYLNQNDVFNYSNGRLNVLQGAWKLFDLSGRLVLNGGIGDYIIPVGAYVLQTKIGVSKIINIK